MYAGNISSMLVLSTFFIASAVQSEDYDMTVKVDEATVSDANMLGMFLKETPNGMAVPRSMRGLAMQLAGETETAASSKIDDAGLLLLDNGASVVPTETDAVSAILQDPFGNGADANINFSSFLTPSGKTHFRACAIHVCLPTGERVLLQIPPVAVERGPDGAGPGKCAVRKCAKTAVSEATD